MHRLLPFVLLLAACGRPESFLELTFDGTLAGSPWSLSFKVSDDPEKGSAGARNEAAADAPDRDTHETNVRLTKGTIEAKSGNFWVKVTQPDVNIGTLPPMVVRAGNHPITDWQMQFGAILDFLGQQPLEIVYEDAEWVGAPDAVVVTRGSLRGSVNEGDFAVSIRDGRFQVGVDCVHGDHNDHRRLCGVSRAAHPGWETAAPAAWVEDACPAAVKAQFVGTGAVALEKDDHVRIGDAKTALACVDTRTTDAGAMTMCGANAGGIGADGCTWRATAVADGVLGAMAIAGFATCSDGPRYCNTWR